MIKVAGYNDKREIDLLLLNPPSHDLIFEGEGNSRAIPTYGLGIIATIAKNSSFNVGVIDAEAQGIGNLDEIISTINNLSPRFLGCMKIPKRNFLHRKLSETIFLCSEMH